MKKIDIVKHTVQKQEKNIVFCVDNLLERANYFRNWRVSIVGWGTMLQTGMSRVWIPTSLEF
jgi:hypothetical protein